MSVDGSRDVPVSRWGARAPVAETDPVAVEEPLEIRLGLGDDEARRHRSISITMRTPGNDEELALGFLYGEGIIGSVDDVQRVFACGPPAPGTEIRNVVRVQLADGVDVDLARLQRHFYTTSSCGVCGKASLEALELPRTVGIGNSPFRCEAAVLGSLPARLHERQRVFAETGGLHAAALFDGSGNIEAVREDVGRHNALDKLVGQAMQARALPLSDRGILVSGRASFELMQKALMAGCPLLAAIGAPSSLAVELAEEFGMTLVGFLRDSRFNVYAGAQRVRLE